MLKLSWWKDEENVKGANALVSFLKTVVPLVAVAGLTVAGWFGYNAQQSPPNPPPTEAPAQSQAQAETPTPDTAPAASTTTTTTITASGGAAVQTGSGTQVVTGSNSNVSIGFSEEAFFAQLTRREDQIRADLERASAAEKAVLQQQLDKVWDQKEDADAAYQTALRDLENLRAKLARFEGTVPQDRLAQAQAAVGQGDRDVADQVLLDVAQNSATDPKTAAEAAFARAEIAEQEIRWKDAAALYARAAELDPTYDHLRKAAEMAWQLGDHDSAMALGKQLVEVARDSGNVENLARALNGYGLSVNGSGDALGSKALFEEALILTRDNLGETHAFYPDVLNNLAEAHHDLGQLVEAEKLYREVVEIDRRSPHIHDTEKAFGLQNLGDLLDDMGRWEDAKPLYVEAFDLRKANLEETHPELADSLSIMGWVLADDGNLTEALAFHNQAIAIGATVFGPDHPRTAYFRTELASFLKEYPEAAAQE